VEHASDTVTAYRTYGPALVRKAERILLNREDARDVVHNVFAELIARRRTKLDLPYLFAAVTSRCLNLLRDRKTRQRLLVAQEPALRGPARAACEDHAIGLDMLSKLSDRLDERCMEILVCLFVDDLSQDETAQLLGTSRKTVGKRLHKIREAVRALVEERTAEVAS
jgi:RNA polymerase sigma-70 factor (ECF subfamily)